MAQKIHIVNLLNDFGVEFIELTNPAAGQKSFDDCKNIVDYVKKNKLQIKTLTHIRCHMKDARLAIDTGADGIDLLFGTSSLHRKFSHGKDISFIIKESVKVIEFIISQSQKLKRPIIIRFSSEDSFRSDLSDLIKVYTAVSKCGVNRVGIADTVGIATPFMVYDLITEVKRHLPENVDIEFHGHDDAGCAIANSQAAIMAGATHIDTCIMGIGERVGITPLGGFISRMYLSDPKVVSEQYKLHNISQLDSYIADICKLSELSVGGIPFNNPLTGSCAFIHKAGIHAKAVLNNPETYESLNPEVFGKKRKIIVSKITGWNIIKHKAEEMNISLSDDKIKQATVSIKIKAAEVGNLSDEDIKFILNRCLPVKT